MELPLVSIIIPCYNQGQFISDALDSISKSTYQNIEIIIVNDGSTDLYTIEKLNQLNSEGYRVIFQENQGLAGARNKGIVLCSGDYILPLDADNKIKEGFIWSAIEIFKINFDIDVIYGNARIFGDKEGELCPGDFNLQRMMLGNYIDACAIIRRRVFDKIGLYDNMPVMGYEDWDLWLRIGFSGGKFFYLNEQVFEYRMVTTSMMRTVNANIAKQNQIEAYFAEKYADKLDFEFVENRIFYQYKKRLFPNLFRMFIKNYFPSYFLRLIKNNKIYKYVLYDRK